MCLNSWIWIHNNGIITKFIMMKLEFIQMRKLESYKSSINSLYFSRYSSRYFSDMISNMISPMKRGNQARNSRYLAWFHEKLWILVYQEVSWQRIHIRNHIWIHRKSWMYIWIHEKTFDFGCTKKWSKNSYIWIHIWIHIHRCEFIYEIIYEHDYEFIYMNSYSHLWSVRGQPSITLRVTRAGACESGWPLRVRSDSDHSELHGYREPGHGAKVTAGRCEWLGPRRVVAGRGEYFGKKFLQNSCASH